MYCTYRIMKQLNYFFHLLNEKNDLIYYELPPLHQT